MRSRFVRIVHPYLQPIGGVAVGGGLDTSPPYAFKYLYYLRGPQRKSEKVGVPPFYDVVVHGRGDMNVFAR